MDVSMVATSGCVICMSCGDAGRLARRRYFELFDRLLASSNINRSTVTRNIDRSASLPSVPSQARTQHSHAPSSLLQIHLGRAGAHHTASTVRTKVTAISRRS